MNLLRISATTILAVRTQIELSSGGRWLMDYIPSGSNDGEDVEELFVIGFMGGSIAEANEIVYQLNRMLRESEKYTERHIGTQAYAEIDADNDCTFRRSPIRRGKIVPTTDTLNWSQLPGGDAVIMTYEVSWTRAGYWESLTPVALHPIAFDPSGAPSITMQNDDSATMKPWFIVEGSEIDGDLPAPVQLVLQCTDAAVTGITQYFVGHNVNSSPGSPTTWVEFDHRLEGEDGTGLGDISNTNTADAACSDGNKIIVVWSATTEAEIWEYPLTGAQMDFAAGGRFACLIRLAPNEGYVDLYLKVDIVADDALETVLIPGAPVLIPATGQVFWLDTFNLPPAFNGVTSSQDLKLKLYATRASAPNHTIEIDFIDLFPVSVESGFHYWITDGVGVVSGEGFTHESFDPIVSFTSSGGQTMQEWTAYSTRGLFLAPGVTQKFYFLFVQNDIMPIGGDHEVYLQYRPRWRTL
jgi:hypothetical protein